jgi:hypothetical protein
MCRNRLFVKLLTLIFALFLPQCVFAQTTRDTTSEELTSKQVLQHYTDSAKRLKTFHAKAAVVAIRNEKRSASYYHQCSVDLQQKKFSWIWGDKPEFEFDQSTRYTEGIVDTVSHLTALLDESGNKLVVNYQDDFTPLQWDNLFSQIPFGPPLHYHELHGVSKPLYTIVESLPWTMQWQEDGGVKYAVLSAESQKCHFEMWCNPQNDFALKKFVFHSVENNELAAGIKNYTYEVQEFSTTKEFCFPKKITTEVSWYEIEGVGQWPGEEPKKMTIPARTVKNEISFYDVEINPQFTESTFRLKKMPPDHYPVTVINKFQIQHVWLDGKVVPLTDELALARARGHGFIPGVREPRFWLWALGIAMILYAFGHQTYLFFKRRRGND